MLDGGPVGYGVHNALCHVPLKGNGGVEEISSGEEEAHGRESRDGARESSYETGQARPNDGDKVLGKVADRFKVEEEEDGEGGEDDGVDEEKYRRLPIIDAVDRVDLRPVSSCFSHYHNQRIYMRLLLILRLYVHKTENENMICI